MLYEKRSFLKSFAANEPWNRPKLRLSGKSIARALVMLALLLSSSALWAASLVKGPYLLYTGDNTSMDVLWQMDSTTPCAIQWGLDTNYGLGASATAEYGVNHQHAKRISALTPGTLYRYRVQAGGVDYTGSFRAAPPAGAVNLKFFAYGDTRSNPAAHNSVCGAVAQACQTDPAFQTLILHAGDWVNSDSEASWSSEFFTPSAPLASAMLAGLPIMGCRGNHEGAGAFYAQYFPYPYVGGRGYWSFDYGPAHIAVLDQYDIVGGPSDAQVAWLAADLAATRKRWRFVLFHEPAWSAGGGHVNNARAQALLQPLCQQYGVAICFVGHNHYYARCVANGVQHITVGGGGAPLYAPDPGQPNVVASAMAYHYTTIEIVGRQLTFMAKRTDGSVIDSFVMSTPVAASGVRQAGWQLFE